MACKIMLLGARGAGKTSLSKVLLGYASCTKHTHGLCREVYSLTYMSKQYSIWNTAEGSVEFCLQNSQAAITVVSNGKLSQAAQTVSMYRKQYPDTPLLYLFVGTAPTEVPNSDSYIYLERIENAEPVLGWLDFNL